MSSERPSANPTASAANYPWRFFRSGDFDQVAIETGDDLRHLGSLDPKLWATLSCPTVGLELDERTLALIDGDGDGRIRLPEVVAAVDWAIARLQEPGRLLAGGDALPLSAIDGSHPEGERLLHCAAMLLAEQEAGGGEALSVAQISAALRSFGATRFNGDGIVPPASAGDERLRLAILDMLASSGGVVDRGGEMGIDQASLERFTSVASAWLAWRARPHSEASALPLTAATPTAFAALLAVRDKIDDYFARCRLAAFDLRAAEAVNCSREQLLAIGAGALSADSHQTRALPLAQVAAAAPLPLVAGLNPAWARAIAVLSAEVLQPLGMHGDTLSEEQWLRVQATLAPYGEWQAAQPEHGVAVLGEARLRELLDPLLLADLTALIELDRAEHAQAEAIEALDRLVRYCRDLPVLLRNFVNFADFYTQGRHAIFQIGTLYMDGRSCDLCIRIEDVGRHAQMAHLGRIYLAYCDCRRRGGNERMQIAAAFTLGDGDNLMVGRNGIFYDRQGRDWDATIVRLIEHPISVRQAFWSPYKRIARLIGEQVEKVASAREQETQARTVDAVASGGKHVVEASAAPVASDAVAKPAFDVGKFAGIFAAIGLAVGAIGTAIASIVTGFLALVWWQMPLALLGLLLAISLPSMVLAALKLRQRNLAPLLDANGWAINSHARINLSFGRELTAVAAVPAGAVLRLDDPFADKRSKWPWLLAAIAATAAAVWLLLR